MDKQPGRHSSPIRDGREHPSHLQTAVEGALNGHALAGMGSVRGNGRDQRVQFVALLLQLLDQRLDGPLGESLALTALPVAHQRMDNAQAGVRRCGSIRGRRRRHLHHVPDNYCVRKGEVISY